MKLLLISSFYLRKKVKNDINYMLTYIKIIYNKVIK